ncbi:hypothetical protein [Pseudomonas sp. R9.37]|uniref:hypothetical protein n=1 Tax=Pseudomonas sp. R9.37 TaxID=1390498 RepID=UPI000D0D4D02|nr:hypothetical protein [Pseudomonas sp. R9.37]PSL90781.1 hypothetical protein C7U57_28620 [Pseudomonas sp. R9.37]
MLTEKTQEPTPALTISVPGHVIALVQKSHELNRLWQAASDGSPESLGLRRQLERTQETMAVWLEHAVERQKKAAASE